MSKTNSMGLPGLASLLGESWQVGQGSACTHPPGWKKSEESTIMTKTSVQTAIHERVDPVLEAAIYGLVENASHPKTEALTEDAVKPALTLALVGSLVTPPSPRWSRLRAGVTPFGIVLASALAADLAPAIAQSLTPAIVQALRTAVSTEKPGQEKPGEEKPGQEKPGQEAASGEGSGQQEHR